MPEIENPTPEFNEACTAISTQLRAGNLPFNEAVARLSVLVQRASVEGNTLNQARAEQTLGTIQLTKGNLDISIQHMQRARLLASKHYNPNRIATIDLAEGESWRFKGHFDKAIQLYRSSFEYAGQMNNTVLQTYATVNIGLALLSLARLEEAKQAFEDGLALSKKWENPDAALGPLCEIHHGFAHIHLHHHEYNQAWEEAVVAYQIALRSDDPRHSGLARRTLGDVVTHLAAVPDPNYSSNPDDYYRASIDDFRERDAEAEIMLTTFAQAVSLAKRGNHNSAARKLQQAIIAFNRLGMENDLKRATNFRKTILS